MSIMEWTKKNYRTINITVLFLGIYILIFPIVLSILEKSIEGITECPYLMLTGKKCPLCGGTRFISGELRNLVSENIFFFIVLIITIAEIFFRIVNIIKKNYSENRIKLDLIFHLIIFIVYTSYQICFIIKK